MPTGYTYEIIKGITFETFALNCARAFGACAGLRDEPGGGEMIPEEFVPSDYIVRMVRRLESLKQELAELEALTPEDLISSAEAEWIRNVDRNAERLIEVQSQEQSYRMMLAEVEAWNPPTTEHMGLKDFMISQIKESIEIDCSERYKENFTVTPEKQSGSEYFNERYAQIQRSIVHTLKARDKELKSAQSKTKWIKDLRSSLKPESNAYVPVEPISFRG